MKISSDWRRGAILWALLLVAGCTQPVTEVKFVAAQPQFSMLIASDASEFKDRLRGRIIAHYRAYGNIDVINIADLPDVPTAFYDAVLIMDTCLGWSRFNPSIKTFLRRHPEPDNVVLFMTTDAADWRFRYRDVDAITGASAVANETPLFLTLTSRIDHILMSKGELP